MNGSRIRNSAAVLVMAIAGPALAAVSVEEAKQLGGPVLTVFGAEKAGNKDGTIPAYTGEQIKAPASYDAKKAPGLRPDPFNEKPLFSITAQNMAQYADKLTDGTKAMFKRFPAYRIDVYPTHRTHVYPKYLLDNTVKNATSCKTIKNEVAIEGCYGGLPFPIPKTGNEVMWNHLLHYETYYLVGQSSQWLVPAAGNPVMEDASKNTQEFTFYDPKKTAPAVGTDIYFKVRVDTFAPSRKVGEKFMIFDYVDNSNPGRRAWQYIPGQRRIKLAPDLSYDTPAPSTGGSVTMDDSKGFLGALDRFDFKLIGKKEKYIPYNTFNLGANYHVCPIEKVTSTKNFPNPDCVRWELHRTWVVEATVKPEFRHIYKKRIFYWDEDSYASGIAENYDASGNLYRFGYPNSFPFFAPDYGGASGTSVFTDLQTGNYMVYGGQGLSDADGFWVAPAGSGLSWSPEVMAGEGIR